MDERTSGIILRTRPLTETSLIVQWITPDLGRVATVAKGARRLIILPTGHACANDAPPVGAVANALHALTLLIARQLVSELEDLAANIEYFVVPPLCPLVGSPYDFSQSAAHIDRAVRSTEEWLLHGGLTRKIIPGEMRPHGH